MATTMTRKEITTNSKGGSIRLNKEAKDQVDKTLSSIEANITAAVQAQLEPKQELVKVRQHIAQLEKDIEEADNDRRVLNNKVNSLKAKLSVANVNLNTCNEEKEALRVNLNDTEIQVARLEERLTVSTSELDRLRDPANPDSNMNMKKHAINDRKEKKTLKAENENEVSLLDMDQEILRVKVSDIGKLEKELKDFRDMLAVCEKERDDEKALEEEERAKREEMIAALKKLKAESKTFEQQLKDKRVKVGIAMSTQNVHVKQAEEIGKRVKEMQSQLKQTEKKINETSTQLEALKNQHKMTKTALSINNYTKRNQLSRGIKNISAAQSGPGPVKFGSNSSTKTTDKSKVKVPSKASSIPDRTKLTANGAEKKLLREVKSAQTRRSETGSKYLKQSLTSRQPIAGGAKLKEKRNSVQFVPPPKVKVGQKS